ncbi:MAG: hypothetical protein WCT28_01280 [Patescibacteria group bacterium]|jgi:hypothetical protein
MERKTKIEIAVAVGIILIFLGFIVWWKWPVAQIQDSVVPSTSNIPASTSKTTDSNAVSDVVEPPVVKETSASTVARTFVERFGSYSSEADAANIEDVLSMATPSFQKQLEKLVKDVRAASDGAYYGISTVVITTPKIISASSTQTVLSMTTQREETIDAPGNTLVKYQSITVTLIKSGTTWLVDGYVWTDGV